MNFNWSSLVKSGKEIMSKGWMLSKRNAPILLTGSSIAIGWWAVYLFWKESRKADKWIEYEESKVKEKTKNDDAKLPKKEKFIIYLQYCWLSLVLGITSTGLAVAGQKLSMDRLRDAYLMMQLINGKAEKTEKIATGMKEDGETKKFNLQRKKMYDEDFSEEEMIEAWNKPGAKGNILVLDHTMHIAKRMSSDDFSKGIYKANDLLLSRYRKLAKKYWSEDEKENSAFYVKGDYSYISAVAEDRARDENIYSTIDLAEFLQCFGLIPGDTFGARIGEINEFRCYDGKHNPLKLENIVKDYKNLDESIIYIEDSETGEIRKVTVYDMDYIEFLSPTSEFLERNPL